MFKYNYLITFSIFFCLIPFFATQTTPQASVGCIKKISHPKAAPSSSPTQQTLNKKGLPAKSKEVPLQQTYASQSTDNPLQNPPSPGIEAQKRAYDIYQKPVIRVLIDEYALDETNPLYITIASEQGITLKSTLKNHARLDCKKKYLTFKITTDGITIPQGDKKSIKILKDKIILLPTNGIFIVNNQGYEGICTLHHDKQAHKVIIVNTLPLENYVYAVLPSEAYPSWPLEMHKVQAIATRTYALHHLHINKNIKKLQEKPYDIVRTNFHQTYRGIHSHNHLRQAVQETEGVILTHQDKPIIAMFDACCAGAVPAHMACHNFADAPYLARKQKCTFCKKTKLFSWKKEVHLEDFTGHLKTSPPVARKVANLGPLTHIQVAKKDQAGLVQKLVLKSRRGLIELAGSSFQDCMRRFFRSMMFTIKRKKNLLIVNGNGYGHQTGLCQHGAREMVRRGWSHQRILAFYYPKTTFSHVSRTKSLQNLFA